MGPKTLPNNKNVEKAGKTGLVQEWRLYHVTNFRYKYMCKFMKFYCASSSLSGKNKYLVKLFRMYYRGICLLASYFDPTYFV